MAQKETLAEFMPKQVLNRHWVWIFLWYAAGIGTARHVAGAAWWVAAGSGIAGITVLFLPAAVSRRSYWGTALLFLSLGCALYGLRVSGHDGDALGRFALTYPRRQLVFEGSVSGSQIYSGHSDYTTFIFQAERVRSDDEWRALSGKVHVRWSKPTAPVHAGMEVRISGRLSPHLGVVNHGVSGMEDFYRAQGIFSHISTVGNSVERISVKRWSPRYWISVLRQQQHDRLARAVPESVFPFVLGVWLGERSQINQDTYQDFIHAGTAHVLAVSGVHVAIITFTLSFLLKLARTPRRLRALLVITGVLGFALMTGARTATLRAAMMFCLYYLSEFFDREPDPLSTLGLSGFLMLSWNPALLFNAGFLLSFGSVGSIMLFYPGLSRLLAFLPQPISGSLAMTLSVQVITIPIAAWHFNIVPLLGILANLVVVPLLSVVLWVCLVSGSVGLLLPPIALLLGHALLPVIKLIEWTNAAVVRFPGAFTTVTRPGLTALLLYAAAAALLFPLLYDARQRKRNAVLVPALFLLALLLWKPLGQPATVDILDVGRGDATFVRTPGCATLLVDGGDVTEYTDAGVRIVAPFLRANGVARLDYVVVSHAHRDHIGGLFAILEQFRVGTVVLGPEVLTPSELEKAFVARCREKNIPILRVQRGASSPLKGAEVRVLHPCREWAAGQREHDRSLVLELSWPGMALLLAGDIEEKAEAQVIQAVNQTGVILKVPHHGSPTSNTEAFLERTQPALAVASMQTSGSRSTLMTPGMVSRYEERGIPLLRTDWHGGIRIRADGQIYRAITARGMRGYSLRPQAANQ